MMRKLLIILVALLFNTMLFAQFEVEPNIRGLQYRGYPKWFNDSKLGIIVYFGLYSVPSWSENGSAEDFYLGSIENDSPKNKMMKAVYGDDFKYENFAQLFKNELFDAEEWADIFAKSGAKYVLMTSKYQDGYCLWNSKHRREWNTVTNGPGCDIIGEFAQAIKNKDLKMGLYYSLTEWTHPLYYYPGIRKDNVTSSYVNNYAMPQLKDLIESYEPLVLFVEGHDNNDGNFWNAEELIAWYYNQVGCDAVVNDGWGENFSYGFGDSEFGDPNRPWVKRQGLTYSYGLNRNAKIEDYLTDKELIHALVKNVSHGGGMMLCVAPSADGIIPLLQQERLLSLGKWLEVNGEAIYGSYPYRKFAEEESVTYQSIDSVVNFDWTNIPPDKSLLGTDFSAEWTGYIGSPVTNEFTIEVETNESVRIWINNKLRIDKWGNGNNKKKKRHKVDLKFIAGRKYPIKIEYSGNSKGQALSLYWEPKGQKREIIPSYAFSLEKSTITGRGLNAIYTSSIPYIFYTVNNNALYATIFDWPSDNKVVLRAGKPSNGAAITLVGREGELPWDFDMETKELIIDISDIKPSEMPCSSAWVFRIK